MSDSDYYALRAAEARQMADRAAGPSAQAAHRQLAELYTAASGTPLPDKAVPVSAATDLAN